MFLLFAGVLFIIISCKTNDRKRDAPSVEHIDVNLTLIRYDQLLSKIDTNNVAEEYKVLSGRYEDFTNLYFKQLTGMYREDQDSFELNINYFLTDSRIRKLMELINDEFHDFHLEEASLKRGCQYLNYYFPAYSTPKFYTMFSEYGYQTIIFSDKESDAIGIGLDFYLGSGFDYKSIDPSNPAFSDYLTRSYNRDHIVKNAFDILVEDLVGATPGNRFIDLMIHNGKKLFLLEKLLPHVSDTIILGYSSEQLDWVRRNELQVWNFFMEKDIMYQSKQSEILKYLNPSPQSPGMPVEAPGMTGNYLGLQIVKSFIVKNPEMSLQELIEFKDAQKLMELSKYKPRRR